MSRVGKAIITLPAGVDLTINGDKLSVKGPLGQMISPLPAGINMEKKDNTVQLTRANEERQTRQLHGMARAILSNSVVGVSKGWQKNLELVGVGYRAQLKGNDLVFSLGYSHEVKYPLPAGIKATVTDQVRISVTGVDRQLVGQVAAEIRSLRPPEPYKAKGVRYSNEVIRRKAGKTGKAGKGK